MRKPLTILIATVLLAGCANTLLSDDRIRESTAGLLGEPVSSVTISDRHYDGMTNTYYIARTSQGATYACTINGGTVLSAGIVNPPQCTRK